MHRFVVDNIPILLKQISKKNKKRTNNIFLHPSESSITKCGVISVWVGKLISCNVLKLQFPVLSNYLKIFFKSPFNF